MKRVLLAIAVVFSISAQTGALGQGRGSDFSQAMSVGSFLSVIGSSFVVAGPVQLIHGSTQLTVTALESAGESVVVVMRGVSDVTTVSIKTSATAVGTASVVVGSAVQVVAESAGSALYVAGKLIAFIPNEIGRALIHQSRHEPVAR